MRARAGRNGRFQGNLPELRCGVAAGGFDLDGITSRISGVQVNHDFFGLRCNKIDSDVVRSERQTATTPIDQHGEFHLGGTAVVEEFVKRRFDRAPREQDIVDEDYARAMDVAGNLRRRKLLGNGMMADIVTVKRDIERSGPTRNFGTELRNYGAQAAGELDASIRNPKEQNWHTVSVAVENGAGQALNRSPYFACADRLMFGHEARLWRPANER